MPVLALLQNLQLKPRVDVRPAKRSLRRQLCVICPRFTAYFLLPKSFSFFGSLYLPVKDLHSSNYELRA